EVDVGRDGGKVLGRYARSQTQWISPEHLARAACAIGVRRNARLRPRDDDAFDPTHRLQCRLLEGFVWIEQRAVLHVYAADVEGVRGARRFDRVEADLR